jgi:competence protein ComEC
MKLGIDGMTYAARWVAGWSGAVVAIPAFPETALIVMLAGGLWLCLWIRPWRWFGVPVVLLGAGLAANIERPAILVGEEGRLVAVRGPSGLSAIEAPATTFALKRWLAADGDTRAPDEVRKRSAFYCDLAGCIAKVAGKTVAVPRSPAALPEDCRRADMIILSFPRPAGCSGRAQVLDRQHLFENGALAVFTDPHHPPRILSVEDGRGRRPWSHAGLEQARRAYWR